MFGNFFKIAIRNLLKQKSTSFINIFGLAMGMAVALLIGLWIKDELAYDRYHDNYDRIARVFQHYSRGDEAGVGDAVPIPLAAALRNAYGSDFTSVVMYSPNGRHNIAVGEKKFSQLGHFMEAAGPEMLSLRMLQGARNGLADPYSIMLSASLANSLFGEGNAVDNVVKLDNRLNLKVTGVYEDLPDNSSFSNMSFITPWELFITEWQWVKDMKDEWNNNMTELMVEIAPGTDMKALSAKISALKTQFVKEDNDVTASLFLHPMRKWHLYSNFENGVNKGGQIQFLWLFGTIGLFVLLLACINFMNLSTARSEKRAKEVGIRKAIGSVRGQLIRQFFCESVLVSFIAFLLSLLVVQLTLPWFNQVADKSISIPWGQPWFWLSGIGFSLFTGFIAGSYPALYLSSFQPVKVLKGTFRAGRYAALPRKALVVLQFSVSVLLISGTVIIYKQIQFAKDRSPGYERNGLISVQMTTPEIYQHYQALRRDLLNSGAAAYVAVSQGPLTNIWSWNGGFTWRGKTPGTNDGFATVGVEHSYGKTLGWQFLEGRDFSIDFPTDSSGLILNEAAVKYIGIEHPVGESITWRNKRYTVLGVVKDVIMTSPYEPVPRMIFYVLPEPGNFVNVKLDPAMGTGEAMKRISALFKKHNPAAPFEYTFADEEYAQKFGVEVRIGKLATFFAALAILISSLGLFGLASFMAEQRTKEIGIRKVMGASTFNLWRMLSKDFVILVLLSCCIATPLAWYFLRQWLLKYEYHTTMPWWIFAGVGAGALLIAMLTVSYQATKAALANPVKSLRSE
ncbi:ABC transporter permease [Chitinophaga sp. XS-30]|uniref:ABC transporter permease n=1 Tax=Chitinophaga sp. XS-30 TaxID=2604421 RepID=UPI0011DDD5BD|nr:ABC transporter permease [Chitinophaga sp. XS-30]QEH42895.1 FtsX-like permease family protein [Chitinophaga sp. XS-30]